MMYTKYSRMVVRRGEILRCPCLPAAWLRMTGRPLRRSSGILRNALRDHQRRPLANDALAVERGALAVADVLLGHQAQSAEEAVHLHWHAGRPEGGDCGRDRVPHNGAERG